MTEIPEMRLILLDSAKAGATLFRNNTGMGWAGRYDRDRSRDGTVVLHNARPLHAGLCTGSSDLIGPTPVLITPEHVGQVLAVFTALEVKTEEGRLSKEQRGFLRQMTALGAIAGVARTPLEMRALLGRFGPPVAGL